MNGMNIVFVAMDVLHDLLLPFLKDIVRPLSTLFHYLSVGYLPLKVRLSAFLYFVCEGRVLISLLSLLLEAFFLLHELA